MSRTSEVLKNRNKVEKSRKARRKNEIELLKNKSAFKAKMYDELKHVEVILKDNDVDAVIISVPDASIAQFSAAIYADELSGYEITQVEGQSNLFYIRRKFIVF